jgi:hypothetical protein
MLLSRRSACSIGDLLNKGRSEKELCGSFQAVKNHEIYEILERKGAFGNFYRFSFNTIQVIMRFRAYPITGHRLEAYATLAGYGISS